MRMFIAASLPADDAGKIFRETSEIRSLESVRSVPFGGMHVTLCFLGERSLDDLPEIVEAMEQAVLQVPPFEVSYRGIGAFPSPERARVIVLPLVQGVEQLQSMHYFLYSRLGGENSRRFLPHITVGRVKARLPELSRILKKSRYREQPEGRYTICSIALYESVLLPTGAEYKKLAERNLRNNTI